MNYDWFLRSFDVWIYPDPQLLKKVEEEKVERSSESAPVFGNVGQSSMKAGPPHNVNS
jgi:hypothetical protein